MSAEGRCSGRACWSAARSSPRWCWSAPTWRPAAPPTRRRRPRTPASPGPGANPQASEIADQFTLSALDGAACELGVSRETLAQALATPEARERFTERYGIDDAKLAEAIRAGLLRAVDDAEEAGALSPLIAAPAARDRRSSIPLDQAIELINNARSSRQRRRLPRPGPGPARTVPALSWRGRARRLQSSASGSQVSLAEPRGVPSEPAAYERPRRAARAALEQ